MNLWGAKYARSVKKCHTVFLSQTQLLPNHNEIYITV